jgi:hypothetical protein
VVLRLEAPQQEALQRVALQQVQEQVLE